MAQPRFQRFSRAGDAPPEGAPTPLLIVPATTSPDPGWSAAPEPGGQVDHDLRSLAVLLRASERMDQAADLDQLWPVVAAEAARLLGASAKVMQWTGQTWVVRDHSPSESDNDDVTSSEPEPSGAGGGVRATAATIPRLAVAAGHARSVLVTTLDCSALSVPTRLVWTSSIADAFVAAAELAAAYTRIASGAVHRTQNRMHLQEAVTARHRIGMAQGMVMAHHQVSADEAFDLLVRRSQSTNVQLSDLADHIIATGDLDMPNIVQQPRRVNNVSGLDSRAGDRLHGQSLHRRLPLARRNDQGGLD